MAPDDDSGDDAERTRIAPALPPTPGKVPAAAAPPPAAVSPPAPAAPPSASAEDDRTRVVPAAPPIPPRVAPAPSVALVEEDSDRTRIVTGGAPRIGPAPAAPAAAPETPPAASAPPTPAIAKEAPVARATPATPAAPEPAALDDMTVASNPAAILSGEDAPTVVVGSQIKSTMRLERVLSSGNRESIALERHQILLGRGYHCDIELRSPTASRQHATIAYASGHWTIEPSKDKPVYVDGKRAGQGAVRLRDGMALRLGDDEFVVIDGASSDDTVIQRGLWAQITGWFRRLFGRAG